MKIMGLDDLFQKAVNFSSQIDFSESKTPDTVSIFESTIRYVGGLLSAYELNGNQPQVLVDKAQQLTDKLALGFAASAVPFGFVNFTSNQPVLQTVRTNYCRCDVIWHILRLKHGRVILLKRAL
jgi:mannosyl-oligosaccharide alpha-1,2-mannosidase